MRIGSLLRRMALGLVGGALLLTAACSPVYTNHGYVPDDTELAAIEVGKTTREEVAAQIGAHPRKGFSLARIGISSARAGSATGCAPPVEIDRQVLAISFDSADRVANIERFGLQDGEVIVMSRRVTDSGIKGVSLIGQLLGSLGRVTTSQFE